MGNLYVDHADLPRFLRVHDHNGEEFVASHRLQADTALGADAGGIRLVYAYPVVMSASDPQQDRFTAHESPPLDGGGVQIPLEEWGSAHWETLKATAMHHVVEWLNMTAADNTELHAMLRSLDEPAVDLSALTPLYNPSGYPTTDNPNVCLHPATSQEFANRYFDLVQDFHWRKGLKRLPFWLDAASGNAWYLVSQVRVSAAVMRRVTQSAYALVQSDRRFWKNFGQFLEIF
jgi:hypothetical protein